MERPRVKKKLTEEQRFAYRLCLAIGVVHPDELLHRITYSQWLGWLAYYNAEPWGELRADLRGLVQAQFVNAHRMPPGFELPSPTYPYWEDTSPEGIAAKVADHKP